MKQKRSITTLILSALVMLLLIMPQFDLGSSVETIPPTVTKSVSPQDVYVAGTGYGEETMVTIEVTGAGGTSTTITPLDVVFGIDSSGSMQSNDPSGLRKTAAKSFIDKMDSTRDQAGVVSWDSNIDFTFGLSNNFAAVKAQINNVDSSGGTNLNVGLNASITMLDNTKQDPAAWVIIFLTDGQGTYTPAGSGGPASVAASKGYVIYSIGLTIGCNSPLVDMANATGGKCYSSPSPANLQAIFDEIFEEIVTSTIPYDVDVTEVTQSYIIEEGSFNIAPDSQDDTTFEWDDIGSINDGDPDMSADETVTLTFTAKCSIVGDNLPVEDSGAEVCYNDNEGAFAGCVAIPQAYINCKPIPVALDIKPGSCPNALGLSKKGVLPVAILGTEFVDVTQIDPASIVLSLNDSGVGPLRWAYEDVATPFGDEPFTGKSDCDLDCTTERKDGYLDLTLKFNAQEVINLIPDHLRNHKQCLVFSVSGTLTEEFGLIPFAGEDVVSIRGE